MNENNFQPQYKILLEKARHDIVLVEQVMDNLDVDPEIIAFHLQQAVEKTLKALLSYKSISFPKTHDLEDILEVGSNNGIALPKQKSSCYL
jgi:HEPN domain-containing protein